MAIGDVFILSGQSNMDYETRYLDDYEEFYANANNLYIVLEGSLPHGFGRWWNRVATNRMATVEYNKTYDEYLELIDGLQ